ncbi:MAG: VWA domain-containing protein [Acidobacteriota bacterium]
MLGTKALMSPIAIPTPRPLRSRFIPGVAVMAFLATALLTGGAVAQGEPEGLFVERVDVNVINVEVFVTDKEGRRVAGLGWEDFELYEDGQPVEISNFYSATRGDVVLQDAGAGVPLETGTARPSAEDAASERPEDQRLNLLVYVDHFNLRPASRQRLLEDLGAFVEDRLGQGDRVMLTGFDGSVELVQGFTEDRELLRQGIEAMSQFATGRQAEQAQRRRIMRLMLEEPLDLQTAYDFLRSYVQSVRADSKRSAVALQSVVRSMGGLPGRKALVYVSEGLPMRPGEDLYLLLQEAFTGQSLRNASIGGLSVDPIMESIREDQGNLFRDITREANAHQVTLYTLDARGSFGESSLGADVGGMMPGSGNTVMDAARTMGFQEPLIMMAEATGGTSVLNTFNFDGALDSMARDFDTFYSLGYRSPHGGDGKYHKVEVRVKRPDLKVRHRTGFVDKPPVRRVEDRTLASLLLGMGQNPLGVEVDFGTPEKKRRGRFVLPVLVRVPLRDLTLLPSGRVERGQLRFFVAVKDDEGTSEPHDEPYPIEIPRADVEKARAQQLGYATQLLIGKGVQTVAVGVWDELSGTESFVHKTIRVGK